MIYTTRFLHEAETAKASIITLYAASQQAFAEEIIRETSFSSSTKNGSITLMEDSPSPIHDITPSNIQGAKEEFVALLGEDGVNDKVGELLARTSTAWSPAPPGSKPLALIVYPRSTEEVSAIAKICHRRRLPMTGYSGGTSLEGALATTFGGVSVDFRLMSSILAVHERDLDVVVQPAVGWEALNEVLAPLDLFFPPDPGPGAQIGGMIATGCSGTNAYRYGTMKDWVVSVTAVLADGTIVKTRHRPRKSSAGYNLTQLFVGASGTLGLVTEAVLRVTSKPENVTVAVAAFPTSQAAVNTAIEIVQRGLPLAAMELLDGFTMHALNSAGSTSREWAEVPTMFFKFSGTPSQVKEQLAMVQRYSNTNGVRSFEAARDAEQVVELWAGRKTALWSLFAVRRDPDDIFLSADVAVPISRLGDIVDETSAAIEQSGLIGSCLGHVGDGNFHTTVFYSKDDEKEKEKALAIITEVQKRGVEMEGTVTGEHGIGYTFRDALRMELGEDTIAMMRQIKFALDPLCLLNCDKVIRMIPPTDSA